MYLLCACTLGTRIVSGVLSAFSQRLRREWKGPVLCVQACSVTRVRVRACTCWMLRAAGLVQVCGSAVATGRGSGGPAGCLGAKATSQRHEDGRG